MRHTQRRARSPVRACAAAACARPSGPLRPGNARCARGVALAVSTSTRAWREQDTATSAGELEISRAVHPQAHADHRQPLREHGLRPAAPSGRATRCRAASRWTPWTREARGHATSSAARRRTRTTTWSSRSAATAPSTKRRTACSAPRPRSAACRAARRTCSARCSASPATSSTPPSTCSRWPTTGARARSTSASSTAAASRSPRGSASTRASSSGSTRTPT